MQKKMHILMAVVILIAILFAVSPASAQEPTPTTPVGETDIQENLPVAESSVQDEAVDQELAENKYWREFANILDPGGTVQFVRFADLDLDADLDIIALAAASGSVEPYEKIHFLAQNSSGFSNMGELRISCRGVQSLTIGDFGGGPLPDIMVACSASSGQVDGSVEKLVDTSAFTYTVERIFNGENVHAITTIPLPGEDGIAFTTDVSAKVYIWRAGSLVEYPTAYTSRWNELFVADVNGDGMGDLVNSYGQLGFEVKKAGSYRLATSPGVYGPRVDLDLPESNMTQPVTSFTVAELLAQYPGSEIIMTWGGSASLPVQPGKLRILRWNNGLVPAGNDKPTYTKVVAVKVGQIDPQPGLDMLLVNSIQPGPIMNYSVMAYIGGNNFGTLENFESPFRYNFTSAGLVDLVDLNGDLCDEFLGFDWLFGVSLAHHQPCERPAPFPNMILLPILIR